MNVARSRLSGLAVCVALLLAFAAAPGCTSERLVLELDVLAKPNPVAGAQAAGGRRWDYEVAISNPTAVGVTLKYYHTEIFATDTGYSETLQAVRPAPLAGRRIEPGATFAYAANRSSGGSFARGRERRIYHAEGDDGRYYSGEVVVQLQ